MTTRIRYDNQCRRTRMRQERTDAIIGAMTKPPRRSRWNFSRPQTHKTGGGKVSEARKEALRLPEI